MPVGRAGGVNSMMVKGGTPPVPTGSLYSPQFHSHQDSEMMAARRTRRSTSMISRENRGLGGGGGGGRWLLPIKAYAGRFRPKVAPFSGFRLNWYTKG